MYNENSSVVAYLEENKEELTEYFNECRAESKQPNYSEFCRKYLNGETKEGVSFSSIKLKRKELTLFLRNKYKLWIELNFEESR